MKNIDRWIDILIFNFCVVALLGFTLRSKILFSIPFLDYNRLLDAHFHFAFGGWVTLALVVLMSSELLSAGIPQRRYTLISGLVLASAWVLLIGSPLPANSIGASVVSTLFIVATYIFSGYFLKDFSKAKHSATVRLLAVSAIICLVLSSIGIFTLAYLFATKSLSAFGYRDSLYTYLHLQYNGFFTLAVFALLFNKLETILGAAAKKNAYLFSVALTASVIPSMFLTYLWRDPIEVYRVIAIAGSIMLLITFFLFIRLLLSAKDIYSGHSSFIRAVGALAMGAFGLKVFLQSFTLFPAVGNAVFGDRPVIIGFLHLVFLGFVTLFLIGWFAQNGFLNLKLSITKVALFVFISAVVLNEVVLMTQGLGAMFIKSSYIFPWLLWGLSIALFSGALLLGFARLRSKQVG